MVSCSVLCGIMCRKVNILDVNQMSFTEFLMVINEHEAPDVLVNLDFEKPLEDFYHNRLDNLKVVVAICPSI